MRLFVMGALLALLLPPNAAAHAGGHGTTQVQPVEGNLVLLGLPDVNSTFAAWPTKFLLDVRNETNGAPFDAPVARLLVRHANESTLLANVSATRYAAGSFRVNLTFPSAGPYVIDAFVGALVAKFNWSVFPATAYRIVSPNSAGPWYANDSLDVRFDLFDARANASADPPNDAALHVEHWNNNHTVMLWQQDEPLAHLGGGEFAWRAKVTEPGMYHVYFTAPSLGLSKADVPMVHVFAYGQDEKPVSATKNVPDAPLPLALAAGALVALAARRRRA